jgi:hypothetical protein
MAADQGLKARRADAQKLAVAQGHQLGGMLMALCDQGHFPDRLTGRHQRHHPALALSIGDEDSQRPRDHQEQGCVVFPFAVE